MSVVLSKLSSMETDAESYSKLGKPQYEMGSAFIRELELSKSDRVVDMGCGTGDITKFAADIIDTDGKVIGVDPDEARINFAQEKYKDAANMQFLIGDSRVGFPHHNEQYYDYHISTNVYHWLTDDEKLLYLHKAYECLKPGGMLAILCAESGLNDGQHIFPEYLTMEQHTQLFNKLNLFTDVVIHRRLYSTSFASFLEFKRWFESAACQDLDEMQPEFLRNVLPKYLKEETDGSFTMQFPSFIIKARK